MWGGGFQHHTAHTATAGPGGSVFDSFLFLKRASCHKASLEHLKGRRSRCSRLSGSRADVIKLHVRMTKSQTSVLERTEERRSAALILSKCSICP